MNDCPIGTIYTCALSEDFQKENDNWLICDGKSYDNTDGIFNKLVDLNIGIIVENTYTSPDYGTMVFKNNTKVDNVTFSNKLKDVLKYKGHYHYNNDYFRNTHTVFLKKKNMVDCLSVRNDTDETNSNIYWIVKYK
jgi:uncharacterized protein YvpB